MEILDKFIKKLEDDTDSVDIEKIIGEEKSLRHWEKWVSLFEEFNPRHMSSFLKYTSANIKLTKEDAIVLLAYVKHVELQVSRVAEMMEASEEPDKKIFDGKGYG
jgi:hypothetical protein